MLFFQQIHAQQKGWERTAWLGFENEDEDEEEREESEEQ